MKTPSEIFDELWQHSENEVVEFKKAENDYSFDKLGKYFSALSNEANLRGKSCAWIIFGVWDKPHTITGSRYRNSEDQLNELKLKISQKTTEGITFRNIHEIKKEGKRVLLFEIPAAPRNIIVRWENVAWSRNGESLVEMNQEKQDAIRFQSPLPDWSAEIVPSATVKDLDELAVAKAKIMFKKVHSSKIPSEEIDSWSLEEFLSHSEMMRGGKLTRAAILLLGNPLAVQKIHPANPTITWVWKDGEDEVIDYEHFTIPFIITVDKIFDKIRNITMRELQGGSLFPDNLTQYEPYSIREALNNCIAHQDYTLNQRITLVETDSYLYYSNAGDFIPNDIESVLTQKGPQIFYRNTCLCHGMVNFNMIDTVGRGIPKMFKEQRRRFFPMPEYDIDPRQKIVSVTIYGVSTDDAYSDLLRSDPNLTLMECLWLDNVRRHKTITKEAAKLLRSKKLIEGRYPRYNIALSVAQKADQVSHYTKETGLEKDTQIKFILQLAKNSGTRGFKRKDAFEVLEKSLPENMDRSQKINYIANLLRAISADGLIKIDEKGKVWYITEAGLNELSR